MGRLQLLRPSAYSILCKDADADADAEAIVLRLGAEPLTFRARALEFEAQRFPIWWALGCNHNPAPAAAGSTVRCALLFVNSGG